MTPKEISDRTGLKILTVGKYLSELTNHYEYLKREVPATEDPRKTRRVVYSIRDEFFNFWFRFVYHNYRHLEEDDMETVRNDLERNFSAFVGREYERIAREFVRRIDLGFQPVR